MDTSIHLHSHAFWKGMHGEWMEGKDLVFFFFLLYAPAFIELGQRRRREGQGRKGKDSCMLGHLQTSFKNEVTQQ
jgi:hypothetical protein